MASQSNKISVAVGIPTMKNFKGLAELFASLWGECYTPFVFNNWSHNHGVSKAWNEILKATRSYDVTVICNDDIIFWDNSFRHLIDFWTNRPKDCIIATGSNEDAATIKGAPDYSCWATNSRLHLEEIGYVDTNFQRGYFEDNDLHHRIRIAGYEGYRVGAARMTHIGSQTQNHDKDNPVVPPKMFEANRAYYVAKWGGVPAKEIYAHPYNDATKDWRFFK